MLSNPIKGIPIKEIALFALIAVTTGCSTTGDPTQGGLFGWSPSKADERASALHAQLQGENDRLESEQAASRRLARQQQNMSGQIDDLNAELSALGNDTRNIERTDSPAVARKAASVRAKIEQTQSSHPDERQVRALRREVESLREEMRLLQQRQ